MQKDAIEREINALEAAQTLAQTEARAIRIAGLRYDLSRL
jgi:hypothetical protein